MSKEGRSILVEIAEVAGEDSARALVAHAGGIRAYIPARAHDDHWLVKCVGRTAADKLMQHFQVDGVGCVINVPLDRHSAYRRFLRSAAERIEALSKRGLSTSKIARAVGCSDRRVRSTLSRLRKHGRLASPATRMPSRRPHSNRNLNGEHKA